MVRPLALTISIFALSLSAGLALAQSTGPAVGGLDAKSNAAGGNPPIWQGSNPPGFGVQPNRPGWDGGSEPPGWSNAQAKAKGWDGGAAPRGLSKR
jgi:hypothetical protein